MLNYTDLDNNLDQQTWTSQQGLPYRIVKYGTTYFINGYSQILYQFSIMNCNIFIINKPLVVPSLPTDTCTTCYKPGVTVMTEIAADTTLSDFFGLLSQAGFPLTNPPYTYLINGNNVYNIQPNKTANNTPWEIAYLNSNGTARDEYLKQYIIQGSIFPIAGTVGLTSFTTLGGTMIQFSYLNDNSLNLFFWTQYPPPR